MSETTINYYASRAGRPAETSNFGVARFDSWVGHLQLLSKTACGIIYLMNIRECEYCGEDYKPRKKRNKYCGNECYVAYRESKKIATTCAECGNEFKSLKHEARKFCGSSCAATFNNRTTPKREPEGKCKECSSSIPKKWAYCVSCRPVGKNIIRMCFTCGSEFENNNSKSKFCSAKCKDAAGNERKRNNYARQAEIEDRKVCLCGSNKSPQSEMCVTCRIKLQTDDRIDSWLTGDWIGGTQSGLSKTIRAYLLEQANYKCSKCGFNTPHPDDNKTILEINHINGDGTDHSPENLEVICPNCHALTSNYRARNKGSGRSQYYLRVTKTA